MKEPWQKGKFTEKKLRDLKERFFVDYPAMMDMFNKLIDYANENGYFDWE